MDLCVGKPLKGARDSLAVLGVGGNEGRWVKGKTMKGKLACRGPTPSSF